MAAYRRVYDSRHRRLTAKNRDQPRNPTLGSRVRASFTFYVCGKLETIRAGRCRERRYADHGLYFRMHHFVVKFFSKFSSPQAARARALTSLTKILRTFLAHVQTCNVIAASMHMRITTFHCGRSRLE